MLRIRCALRVDVVIDGGMYAGRWTVTFIAWGWWVFIIIMQGWDTVYEIHLQKVFFGLKINLF